MKKYILILILALSIIFLSSCMPMPSFNVYTPNAENFDFHLLVKLSDNDYSPAENSTPIAMYDKDGYCSITEHGYSYKDSYEDSVQFYLNRDDNEEVFATKYNTAKIAVCDEEGRILQISEEFNLISSEHYGYYKGVDYDFSTNSVSYNDEYLSPFKDRYTIINLWHDMLWVSLIFAVFGLIHTSVIKWGKKGLPISKFNIFLAIVLAVPAAFTMLLSIYALLTEYLNLYYSSIVYFSKLFFVVNLIFCFAGVLDIMTTRNELKEREQNPY